MRKAYTVEFGLGGHYEILGPDTTLSGYARPDNWTPDPETDYKDAVVVDKTDVLRKSPIAAWHAPLLKIGLAKPERFTDIAKDSTIAQSDEILDRFGPVGQLAKVARSGGSTGLDWVGLDDYLWYWRAVGARFGRVVDGKIVFPPRPSLAEQRPLPF